MTVLVTLTLAGADTGPFDLYSDADGFLVALASGVSKAALEAGYSLTGVPDNATIIRTQSEGICTNFIDMFISGTITTTTTSSSTTSTSTTPSPGCIIGDNASTATCIGGETALFTVSSGNTAFISPSGYYYSGTGTRYYTCYIMDSTNTTVLYTFSYTQVGSNPGVWTSSLTNYILPAGTYRLRTDIVDCADNGSGTFSLTATCNDTNYYYYNILRYDCTQGCEPGTTAIGRATNALDLGYFYHPPADTFVYEILNPIAGSYYNVDLFGSPSRATCSEACSA